ncbi:MAG: hypothetical protein PVI57_06500 [Gemmatimonadota bacterium]
MNLDALVAPLRADVVSGATTVARTAAEVVRRAAVRIPADSPDALRGTLGELTVKILDAQPAMAPLVCLARVVLESVAQVGSVEEVRRVAARTAEDFRSGVDERTREVGRRAAAHLPRDGTVVTLSSSSTVRAALLQGTADPGLRVVCLESRPMQEGRMLADAMARAGVRAIYAVDAAAGALLEDADLLLLGADSIGDAGVVNKIGSALLAREAARLGLPVVVTADTTKLLPPGFPQHVADDRPPEEVWRAPSGVHVWNRYFEVVSSDHVSVIVTEEDDLTPADVGALREALTVPPEVRAWADARGG